MEQLNQKIKDIYIEDKTPLPLEFSWDEMGEDILKNMEKHKGDPPPAYLPVVSENKFNFLSLFLIILIISIILLVLANFLFKKNTADITAVYQNNPPKENYLSKQIEQNLKLKNEGEIVLDSEIKATANKKNNTVLKNENKAAANKKNNTALNRAC